MTAPTFSSTKETTNYARLCRLMVDVGTQALRDTLDAIHPPANLHTVLAGNKATLQPLRTRKVINAAQWGKLFPAISTSVSSVHFDISLLMVLLRNLCGLPSPATGWDKLPAVTDVSREADIARVKYYRNTVYGHAECASVDDAAFNAYWSDIRDALVRLGGVKYKTAIDKLETEVMDPDLDDRYKELLRQWKKDEDNVKDQLDELTKKVDNLESTVKGKDSKAEELLHESIKCKEKYHENEAVQYYCQDCNVCICQKCGILIHNRHAMMDIQQAVEQKKMKMKQVFARVKEQMVIVDKQIIEQTELMRISEEEICAAEKEVKNIVQEIIRIAREHKTAAETKLAEIKATQQATYNKKLKEFRVFKDQLRNSVEFGEDIVQKKVGLEILQAGNTVVSRCEKLLAAKYIEIFNPQHVIYRVNAEARNTFRHLVPGQVITRYTDPSKSVAEGNGLQEAEIGAETDFTVTTRDSEGKLVYDEDDQVTVKIRSPKGEDEEIKPKHCQNGNYSVCYVPKSIGLHDIIVEVSGKPLTGSPWRVQVTAHHYKAFHSFRSREKGPVEFAGPESIAVSEKTGNIAIADFLNGRVQLFDSKWKYLRMIGDQGPCAERIGHPRSVAFTASGDVVVIHNETGQPRKMFLFTEHGQFIKHIGQCLITPLRVSVRSDGHMIIVSDSGDDSVKVLTPDGAGLVQSFKAPDCDAFPSYAVYHEDRFFVSFAAANCVKVFNKRGEFQYDIGWEESGDRQLKCPLGLAIDRFNNLIVCDSFNSRLQLFSLDGKFINSFNVGMKRPWSVAVTKDHKVLVSDTNQNVIHVFN